MTTQTDQKSRIELWDHNDNTLWVSESVENVADYIAIAEEWADRHQQQYRVVMITELHKTVRP